MSEITNNIEQITGVSTANTDFVESAQRFVASSIPKELLWFAAAQSTAITASSGYDIQSADSVLAVEREGYPSSRVPFSMSKWIDDSTSLHKATNLHPKHYFAQGKVFIKPDPSAGGSNDGYVYYVDYSQIDEDCDLRSAVVFHSSAQEFEKLASSKITDWSDLSLPVAPSAPDFGSDLTISSVSPATPSLTSVTFTSIDSDVDASNPVFSTATVSSGGVFGSSSAPSYNKPVISLTSTPSISDLSISSVLPIVPSSSAQTVDSFTSAEPSYTSPVISLGSAPTISNLSITSILPVAPSLTSSSVSFSTSAPTYTSAAFSAPSLETISSMSLPNAPVAPGIPSFSYTNASVSDIVNPILSISDMAALSANAPSYVSPSLDTKVAFSAFTSGLTETDPGVLTVVAVPPSTPSLPTISYSNAALGDTVLGAQDAVSSAQDAIADAQDPIAASVESYTGQTNVVAGTNASGSNLSTYTPPTVTGTTTSLTEGMIAGTIGTHQIDFSKWFDIVGDYLEGQEDFELAGAQIQKIQSYINAYQAEVQSASAAMQATIQDAQNATQASIADSRNDVTILSAGMSSQTSAGVAKMQAATSASVSKMGQSTTAATAKMQQSTSAATQKMVQSTTAAIQRMQQSTNVNIQNASKTLEASIQDYAMELQKYQADIGMYQADVGKEIQQYQQQLALYNSELNVSLQAWQKVESDKVDRFRAGVEDSVNSFNKDNVVYQEDMQRKLQNFQKDVQEAIQNAAHEIDARKANVSKDVQLNLQNALQQYKTDVDVYAGKIQLYSGEVASYQAAVNTELQRWTGEEFNKKMQKYQTDYASLLQEYTANMQNQLNVFNDANAEYQAQLQISIQDAQLDSQDEAQKIEKYNSELQSYQADVNKEVQEYQQNLAGDIQVWQAERTTDLQKYASDIQSELNKFNMENSIYQATVQEKIQEAQLKDNNEARKLQNYQAEIQSYQADVNKQVQQYATNEVQKEIGIWNTNIQSDLQRYATDIQNEVNEFNKDNASFQANIQEAMQEIQISNQVNIAKAQADLQIAVANADRSQQRQLQNAIQDMQAIVSDNEINMSKFQADVGKFQADVNKEIQDYSQSFAKTAKEYESKLALYSGDSQKYQAEISEKAQKVTSGTQNATYYSNESKKYYEWALAEISLYVQNNSKMINRTVAAQAAQQQQQQYRR